MNQVLYACLNIIVLKLSIKSKSDISTTKFPHQKCGVQCSLPTVECMCILCDIRIINHHTANIINLQPTSDQTTTTPSFIASLQLSTNHQTKTKQKNNPQVICKKNVSRCPSGKYFLCNIVRCHNHQNNHPPILTKSRYKCPLSFQLPFPNFYSQMMKNNIVPG